MVFLAKTALLALGLSATSHAMSASILADTNRDGTVDERDAEGKHTWNPEMGGMLLANIGNAGRKGDDMIAQIAMDPEPCMTAEDIAESSHDACDDDLYNPQNLAPLLVSADAAVPDDASGFIWTAGTVRHIQTQNGVKSEDLTPGKVRIFRKSGETWNCVNHRGYAPQFTGKELKAGIELGIDARDVRRPGKWDGLVTVTLDVMDKDFDASRKYEKGYRESHISASDKVQLRVAPVLMQHALQPLKRVYIGSLPANPDLTSEVTAFCQSHDALGKRLMERISAVGGGLSAVRVSHQNRNFWVRDWFAPGYMSIPGPGGEPVGLDLLVVSSRNKHIEDMTAFTQLRDGETGAVRHEVTDEERKSLENKYEGLGNLVVIPPYTSATGVEYPQGRAIMGVGNCLKTAMCDFINAQEVQNLLQPLPQNSWLDAGHMDEYVQFLPADSPRGWIMVVADPKKGLELLGQARKEGKGQTLAFSHPSVAEGKVESRNIDEVLRLPFFESHNTNAAGFIDAAVNSIMRETKLKEGEVVRIPTLFYATANVLYREQGASWEEVGLTHHLQKTAFYGNVVNGISYRPKHFLAPRPWGPFIDGADIFEKAVIDAFGPHSYDVEFEDTWFTHHVNGGELHCGTNEMRRATNKWWKSPPAGLAAAAPPPQRRQAHLEGFHV